MKLSSYTNFDGTCREAMTFYKDCIGGELNLMVVGETPVCDQMPPDMQDKIMHATLTVDGSTIMGSDMSGPGGIQRGNAAGIVLECNSDEEISRAFNALSTGGQIHQPLGPAFWGGTFGAFSDKFGINWMLNYTPAQG